MIRSGMMSRTRHELVVCCMLIASGCDITRDPTAFEIDDGPIAVNAVLIAGERRIAVLVTRYESTGSADASGDAQRIAPVADAEVRVSGAGQTITLRPDGTAESCVDPDAFGSGEVTVSLTSGCYTGLAEDAIVAGAPYELHVALRDGTVVTGATEVPRPITIRMPEAGSDLEVRWLHLEDDPAPPHPVAWTDPGPDRAVRLRLLDGCGTAWTTHSPGPGGLEEPVNNFTFPQAIDLTGRDSATVGGWYLSCDEAPAEEVDGTLQFAVFDLAYAHYLDTLTRAESIPLADASVGLTGAAGVFTGFAITRLPVRLIVADLQAGGAQD